MVQHLEQGETVAMATVVKRRGSVPREVGAKMLVQRGGKISGTVGGGCGEAEVWRSALNVIDTQHPNMVQVDLTEDIAMESEGVCGGIFDVFVQPWFNAQSDQHDQPSMQDYAQAIGEALQGEQASVLTTIIAAGGPWRSSIGQQMLVHENGTTLGHLSLPDAPASLPAQLIQAAQQAILVGKPHVETIKGQEGIHNANSSARIVGPPLAGGLDVKTSGGLGGDIAEKSAWAEVFIEPFIPPPVLLIAGAGHIAAPLAALASLMNFSVSVTDDRASFANRERFPTAKQILVGDIEAILRDYPITPRTHIVLVTRAHAHDVHGLRAVIESPAAYIGMIGSQRRVWAVFKLLHDEGVPTEKLARVRAPIGLDLGGGTPEEIALSIMSEIVLLRRNGTGTAMSESLRNRYMERLRRLDEGEE
ncbi:MAG TPA: XdhC family protein [Ktedonobacteraceae bacterium]|nr:XdhC family protein [Ktedonobacteraceae bacterium]